MLDAISHGRMGISLASGWHSNDFVLNPQGYDDRKQVLQDRLAQLRSLWSGQAVDREAPGGRTVATHAYPRIERDLEVWLTSSVNPETCRGGRGTGRRSTGVRA